MVAAVAVVMATGVADSSAASRANGCEEVLWMATGGWCRAKDDVEQLVACAFRCFERLFPDRDHRIVLLGDMIKQLKAEAKGFLFC